MSLPSSLFAFSPTVLKRIYQLLSPGQMPELAHHDSCWCCVLCWTKFASSAYCRYNTECPAQQLMKSPSAGPALTLAWTCGSLKHFISSPLAICAPLNGSSHSLCAKGEACTFLTQLAGPYSADAPLSPLAPCLPSSPVLSAPLWRCQSLAPFKERTVCAALRLLVSAATVIDSQAF